MKKKNRRTQFVILTAAGIFVLIAVYALGIFLPEEAIAGNFLNAGQPPSPEHPFGTDNLGRDLLMRTLKGLSASMTVGIAASAISAVIAVIVGVISAAGSGRADAIVNWLIDLMMSVPHTILIILISFSLGRGMKRTADRHCSHSLVQSCASDPGRSSSAPLETVYCGIAQTRKIRRMDSDASYAAAPCTSVSCRTGSDVSSRRPA